MWTWWNNQSSSQSATSAESEQRDLKVLYGNRWTKKLDFKGIIVQQEGYLFNETA